MTESLHADRQRRFACRRGGHPARDASHFGRRTGGDDHASRPTAHDQRAGKCAVGAIGNRGALLADECGIVRNGRRFAREHGRIHFQGLRFAQAQVGGHAVAACEHNDVAAHELRRVDFARDGVAQDRCPHAQQAPQVRTLPFRLQFLPCAEQGVHYQHEADESGVRQMPEAEGKHGCGQQDIHQRAAELAQEDDDGMRRLRGG